MTDLTNKFTIKNILQRHKLWAKKGFGQNFMIDRSVIESSVKVSDLREDDTVLEIGPGLGVLTQELLKKASKVVAVEKDEKMIDVLLETCGGYKNLELINEDILKLKVTGNDSIIGEKKYKIVANLPFYISSPIFRKFLEFERRPESLTVVVQKEVAEKITAKPGKMNILAVSVQFFADVEIVQEIPSSSFFPEPKVEAAILKIVPHKKPHFNIDNKLFFRIVKAGFGEKRKKLVNSLSGGLALSKDQILAILSRLNIDENIRAESLSMNDWYGLYLAIRDII